MRRWFFLLAVSLYGSVLAAEEGTLEAETFRMSAEDRIPTDLEDNRAYFEKKNRFFEALFPLHRMGEPLSLSDGIAKDYFFPTLYDDVTTSVAMFYCDYDAAKSILPSERLHPVPVIPGKKAIVIFTTYHYGKVLGIPSYNEIGVSIPVTVDTKHEVPLIGLKDRNVYVALMPVTTLENQLRGKKIWGLPKEVHEIDMYPDKEDYLTTAREKVGNRYATYLELRVPRSGTPVTSVDTNHLFTVLNGQLKRSFSYSSGTFVVKKHLVPVVKNLHPVALTILGESPSALLLKKLRIEPHPFETRFGTGVSSAFDLPGPVYGP